LLYFPPQSKAQYPVKEKEQVQREIKSKPSTKQMKIKSNIRTGKERKTKKKAFCLISLILQFAKNRRNILPAYNKQAVIYKKIFFFSKIL